MVGGDETDASNLLSCAGVADGSVLLDGGCDPTVTLAATRLGVSPLAAAGLEALEFTTAGTAGDELSKPESATIRIRFEEDRSDVRAVGFAALDTGNGHVLSNKSAPLLTAVRPAVG